MTVSPGYPNYEAVAAAKRGARAALGACQAVPAGYAQTLLVAMDHCEQLIEDQARLVKALGDAVDRLDPGLSPEEFAARYLADVPVRYPIEVRS